MLVLTRKQGQGFILGDDIEITLLEVGNDKVRIAINAPKELSILRKELADARKSNQEALTESVINADELSALRALLKPGDKK